MTDLAGLIERLELASGPDREIDVWLWALSEKVDLEWQGTTLVAGYHGVVGWCDPGKLSRNFRTNRDTRGPGSIPPFTASLDAAVAFAERVLPGCYVRTEPRFHIDGERVDFVSWALRPRWSDWRPDDEWFDRGEGRHAKQVLSILIAVLRALQAQGGSDG